MKTFEEFDHSDIDSLGEENWGDENIPNEAGICPKCGSNNLDYEMLLPIGDKVGYEFVCNNCHFAGYETYNIIFAGNTER